MPIIGHSVIGPIPRRLIRLIRRSPARTVPPPAAAGRQAPRHRAIIRVLDPPCSRTCHRQPSRLRRELPRPAVRAHPQHRLLEIIPAPVPAASPAFRRLRWHRRRPRRVQAAQELPPRRPMASRPARERHRNRFDPSLAADAVNAAGGGLFFAQGIYGADGLGTWVLCSRFCAVARFCRASGRLG